MTYDVVVLLQDELSESDAERISAAHHADAEQVSYHLLVAASGTHGAGGPLATLGIDPGDTFGSDAVARWAGVPPAGDRDPLSDVGSVVERSSRRLRDAGAQAVSFAVTHGELLPSAEGLMRATGSQELVVVASSDSVSGLTLPEWQTKAGERLGASRVQVIEHVA